MLTFDGMTTASMSTTYVPISPNPGLLALPGEIRNEIYRRLLTTRYNFPKELSNAPLTLHPAILRVNRQINEEATNVLHGDNLWIVAQINISQWPGTKAFIPFVSRQDPSHIKYPALHVKLDLPHESTATESTTLIMGVESLPFLLHKLRRRSSKGRPDDLQAAGLTLRLYSSPFHSQPKLQSTCLEPFTLVRGFGRYSVKGVPDSTGTWHHEDMMSHAKSPFKDAGFVKGVALDYLTQGDEAYSLGDCFTASIYYEIGLVFLLHARKYLPAYSRTQAQYPHAQRAREKFEIQTIRAILMAHSLRPWSAMARDRDVIAVGRSWIFDSPFLSKVEQVSVMFCRALSSDKLGKRKKAVALLVGACGLEVTKDDFIKAVLSVCLGL